MKVTSMELIESINVDTDLIEVTFSDDSTAYMLYKYSNSLKFVDQEVIVSFRDDIYKGQVRSFVNTIAIPTHVNLYDKETDFKLYTDVEDNQSNIIFKEMELGDIRINAIMYCTAQQYKSSERTQANWVELIVRDKMWKYTKLRLFDPEFKDSVFTGTYIQCDVSKSIYGLTTSCIAKCNKVPQVDTDVDLACKYVSQAINDQTLRDFVERVNLLDMCKEYLSEDGKGHEIIRMAFELETLKSVKNMLKGFDANLVEATLVMSHSFTLKPNSTFTENFRNITITSTSGVENSGAIMHVLDDNPKEEVLDIERRIVRTIKKTAEDLVNERYWGL